MLDRARKNPSWILVALKATIVTVAWLYTNGMKPPGFWHSWWVLKHVYSLVFAETNCYLVMDCG